MMADRGHALPLKRQCGVPQLSPSSQVLDLRRNPSRILVGAGKCRSVGGRLWDSIDC